MANVNDLTFGVEIETTIPHDAVSVGPHGCGHDIPELAGWKADRDPSIRASNGRKACEFVSPVLRGTEGLKQLLADLATIKGLGAQVNDSCGLHIHVGFDKSNRDELTKLATLVSNFEKAIYASTGTRSRETGRWCNGLNRYGSAEQAMRQAGYNRYHVLNVASDKPTVEFRAFAATLNPVKLVGYIRLCVGLVERSLSAKRTTNWTAKTPKESSPIHRGGEGQTALARLFYQLGWIKGRQSHTFGDLNCEGAASCKSVKKEFMRLARKYDGGGQDGAGATPQSVADAVHQMINPPTRRIYGRSFPVGSPVRIENPGSMIHGMTGNVVQRRVRCSPVVRLADGRAFRVRVQTLRHFAA